MQKEDVILQRTSSLYLGVSVSRQYYHIFIRKTGEQSEKEKIKWY